MIDAKGRVDHSAATQPQNPTTAQSAKIAIKRVLGLKGIKQVKILAGPARGLVMTLDFSGHTPLFLGTFEWELHRFFRDAMRGADLLFDIGGYIGYDALMLAANCGGRVITFEPDPERRPALLDNIAHNTGIASRIIVSPLAVGAEMAAGATTLDMISAEVGAPDFIKLDIDGGEVDALRGGLSMLRRRRPHVVVETHSLELERECGALLVECGYRPIIKHNRRIWREHRAGAPHNRWLLAAGNSRPSAGRTESGSNAGCGGVLATSVPVDRPFDPDL